MCHRPARRGHRSAAWAVSIEVRIQWSDALHERLDAMPDAWGRDELGLLQGLGHVSSLERFVFEVSDPFGGFLCLGSYRASRRAFGVFLRAFGAGCGHFSAFLGERGGVV
jgi:hypothetical protein